MTSVLTGGAIIKCTEGTAPGSLVVAPSVPAVTAPAEAVATIADAQPGLNIPAFGLCMSVSNPQVIAATASHAGVFTPVPCLPVLAGPWMPGSSSVVLGGVPIVTQSCVLMCAWAGEISVVSPGENIVSA